MSELAQKIEATFKSMPNLDRKIAIREVSRVCDVTQGHVKKVLAKANLIPTPRGLRQSCEDRVRGDIITTGVLFCKGWTPKMIGEEINRTLRSVVFYLQCLNLSEDPVTGLETAYFQSIIARRADETLQQAFESELKAQRLFRPKKVRRNVRGTEHAITLDDVWPHRYESFQEIADRLNVPMFRVSRLWRKHKMPAKATYVKADIIAKLIMRYPETKTRELAKEFHLGHETVHLYLNLENDITETLTGRQRTRYEAIRKEPDLLKLIKERIDELNFSEHMDKAS